MGVPSGEWMRILLKARRPELTADARAALSAQMDRPREAFSTFTPKCSPPQSSSSTAATLYPE